MLRLISIKQQVIIFIVLKLVKNQKEGKLIKISTGQ